MRIPKTSRRQFLIGTALASVAALTTTLKTHRQTRLPVDKSLSDNESWFLSDDGPVFQVLYSGPLLIDGSSILLRDPDHDKWSVYRIGQTITQEQVASMTSDDSGPVLYDPATQTMQRLHEVRDFMGRTSNPRYEMPLSPTRRLTRTLGRRYGGHWS